MTKLLFGLGKLLIGTVSFKGGFWGGIFGLVFFVWGIIDIITFVESL